MTPIRFTCILIVVSITALLAVSMSVSAEKIPTNLTIEIKPEYPTINESFNVIGILTTTDGRPLGNKRITLKSCLEESDDIDDFSFIAIKVTDRKGKYEFFRPIDSPPEFLIAVFPGNDEFEPVTSTVLAVRGAGTDNPQIRTNKTGSIMTSSNPQGASIYIDDIKRGVTPQKVAGLSEGSHIVRVMKTGYINETMEAYVTPDIDVSFNIAMKRE